MNAEFALKGQETKASLVNVMSDVARPNWLLKLLPSSKGQEQAPVEKLYYDVLEASRQPVFYLEYEVADTFDGRFDMLCLMMSLMMARLKKADSENKEFAQDLFDAMFRDVDLTLREMGAGDLGVGKRVKKMSEAFLGRLTAYDKGLVEENASILAAAIARNVYRREEEADIDLRLAEQCLRLFARLEDVADADLYAGATIFSQLVRTA